MASVHHGQNSYTSRRRGLLCYNLCCFFQSSLVFLSCDVPVMSLTLSLTILLTLQLYSSQTCSCDRLSYYRNIVLIGSKSPTLLDLDHLNSLRTTESPHHLLSLTLSLTVLEVNMLLLRQWL